MVVLTLRARSSLTPETWGCKEQVTPLGSLPSITGLTRLTPCSVRRLHWLRTLTLTVNKFRTTGDARSIVNHIFNPRGRRTAIHLVRQHCN
jgi:hypothetical protein